MTATRKVIFIQPQYLIKPTKFSSPRPDLIINNNPFQIERESTLQTGYHVYLLFNTQASPAEIGVIAGDIIHNLRSALDQLTYQLVYTNGGPIPSRPRSLSGTTLRNTKLRALEGERAGRRAPKVQLTLPSHFKVGRVRDSGVELKLVSRLLGHSDIRITGDIYAHVLPSLKKQTIDLIDNILIGTN